MDREQLLRRISSATEKRQVPSSPAAAPPPVHVPQKKAAPTESHLASLLRGQTEAQQVEVGGPAQPAPAGMGQVAAPAEPILAPTMAPTMAPEQNPNPVPPQSAQALQAHLQEQIQPVETVVPPVPEIAEPPQPLAQPIIEPTAEPQPLAMPEMPVDYQDVVAAPAMSAEMHQGYVADDAEESIAVAEAYQAGDMAASYEPAAAVSPTITEMPVAEPVEVESRENGELSFRPSKRQAEPVAPQNRMKPEDRPEAHVIACTGNHAIIQGSTGCVDTLTGLTWAVGRMLSIVVGDNRVVAMIYEVEYPGSTFSNSEEAQLRFRVELQGEVKSSENGELSFSKGISSYPGVGSVVHQIRAADLASIYAATGDNTAEIGNLSQDASIPAFVDVSDMLSKHFAVLGSTGCGKSASVSLLLHAAQELVPDLRTIILDPHNEYSRAFPTANTISQANLDLPFWLLQLEEYVEVLFRGKPVVHEEVDALREFIPEAKIRFRDGEDRLTLRSDNGSGAVTADTPMPYRVQDVLQLIDDEMGLLDSRFNKSDLKSLKARIVAHGNDPRYGFMFRSKTISDTSDEVIGNFFRLPGNDTLTTIIQMAGMPSEVVNVLATVLCRLSFELAIAAKGNLKILVVCEEAHRYVPAGKDGFEPTRRAIARIAKEGRKYGSFMAIISQRPSELDPTILSQCSTVFSLRLTNDFDQDLIRRAISSSSANTISFISSLANRECIAFGEGMSTPMRMLFRKLPPHWLPGAEQDVFGNSVPVTNNEQSLSVINRWRRGAA